MPRRNRTGSLICKNFFLCKRSKKLQTFLDKICRESEKMLKNLPLLRMFCLGTLAFGMAYEARRLLADQVNQAVQADARRAEMERLSDERAAAMQREADERIPAMQREAEERLAKRNERKMSHELTMLERENQIKKETQKLLGDKILRLLHRPEVFKNAMTEAKKERGKLSEEDCERIVHTFLAFARNKQLSQQN